MITLKAFNKLASLNNWCMADTWRANSAIGYKQTINHNWTNNLKTQQTPTHSIVTRSSAETRATRYSARRRYRHIDRITGCHVIMRRLASCSNGRRVFLQQCFGLIEFFQGCFVFGTFAHQFFVQFGVALENNGLRGLCSMLHNNDWIKLVQSFLIQPLMFVDWQWFLHWHVAF